MSKFFYKGRIEKMQKYGRAGYNPEPYVKPGTKAAPLHLIVQNEVRKIEIENMLSENDLYATIAVNSELPEDINQLTTILNKAKTTTFEKTPERNDPCSCGSGKKYKKCCG